MSKLAKDKRMIYEIFRACRLCGAGGGYKMPILQNFGVDLDLEDVELRQKIRECVQIECHQDDKMPPLICELCVDKINDFYEFLQMCRQTNIKTRLKLGLPPQVLSGNADAGDCILGVTEPVFCKEGSDDEKNRSKKIKGKSNDRSCGPIIKLTRTKLEEKTTSTRGKRSVSPAVETRNCRAASRAIVDSDTDSDVPIKRRKDKPSLRSNSPPPRSKRSKSPPPRSKTLRQRSKSPKLSPRSILRSQESKPKRESRNFEKDEPKVKRVKVLAPPSPPPKKEPVPVVKCVVCKQQCAKGKGLSSHQSIVHTASYTQERFACNPCAEWFTSTADLSAHNRHHKSNKVPYTCRFCSTDFDTIVAYNKHDIGNECTKFDEVPDVRCESCWNMFATTNLYDHHKCLGEDGRPGGRCFRCKKRYAKYKTLIKHEETCVKAFEKVVIDWDSLKGVDAYTKSRARKARVYLKRIEDVVKLSADNTIRYSAVKKNIDLVHGIVYPYKTFDFYGGDTIDGYYDDSFSCSSDSDDLFPGETSKKKVERLSTLVLRMIFSDKMLGYKVVEKFQKRRRLRKPHKTNPGCDAFDTLFNHDDGDLKKRVSDIIGSLDDDENKDESIDMDTADGEKVSDLVDSSQNDVSKHDTVGECKSDKENNSELLDDSEMSVDVDSSQKDVSKHDTIDECKSDKENNSEFLEDVEMSVDVSQIDESKNDSSPKEISSQGIEMNARELQQMSTHDEIKSGFVNSNEKIDTKNGSVQNSDACVNESVDEDIHAGNGTKFNQSDIESSVSTVETKSIETNSECKEESMESNTLAITGDIKNKVVDEWNDEPNSEFTEKSNTEASLSETTQDDSRISNQIDESNAADLKQNNETDNNSTKNNTNNESEAKESNDTDGLVDVNDRQTNTSQIEDGRFKSCELTNVSSSDAKNGPLEGKTLTSADTQNEFAPVSSESKTTESETKRESAEENNGEFINESSHEVKIKETEKLALKDLKDVSDASSLRPSSNLDAISDDECAFD